jgi:hypothetical protein
LPVHHPLNGSGTAPGGSTVGSPGKSGSFPSVP